MKSLILISTGALIGRPNGRDFRLLKKYAPLLECDGFEFMMYGDWYGKEREIVDFLRENEIHTPVLHCQKSIGESISKGSDEEWKDAFARFEINGKLACDIGAKKMVLHLWDGITSDSNFSNNLKAYPLLKAVADGYGIDLLVENVVCNQKTPMEHWRELYEKYPEIGFIFDTKMAAFHGQLGLLYEKENEWLWRENHIRHYHVNDYHGGIKDWANLKTLPIGSGDIDFHAFFEFVKKTGYQGDFTLESTAFNSEGVVDIAMLNRQVSFMKKSQVTDSLWRER